MRSPGLTVGVAMSGIVAVSAMVWVAMIRTADTGRAGQAATATDIPKSTATYLMSAYPPPQETSVYPTTNPTTAAKSAQQLASDFLTSRSHLPTTTPLPGTTPLPTPYVVLAIDRSNEEMVAAGWGEDFLSPDGDVSNVAMIVDHGMTPIRPGSLSSGKRYCLYLLRRASGGGVRGQWCGNDLAKLEAMLD